MSLGIGVVQREILDALSALEPGSGVVVGDGGSSYRRAAHGLRDRGLVVLRVPLLDGRLRLVAALAPARTRE